MELDNQSRVINSHKKVQISVTLSNESPCENDPSSLCCTNFNLMLVAQNQTLHRQNTK